MGFEVKYIYHPRKEDGGYDTEKNEEKIVKVGKPFEEVPLEKVAAAIMSQLARRDIWVVNVEVVELVRREVSFKECKDGRGITLKNKRYSFNDAAQMVAEDVIEETSNELSIPQDVQPHELLSLRPQQQQNAIDELYSNPNKAAPIKAIPLPPINQNKVLYKVLFDPGAYANEVRRMKLKFTEDKEYPVHQVVPHPSGKLNLQRIALTDDTGQVVVVDEKYFMSVGKGLYADKELNFSGGNRRGVRKPKLSFENEYISGDPSGGGISHIGGIPVDDGSIPDEYLAIPDIRTKG